MFCNNILEETTSYKHKYFSDHQSVVPIFKNIVSKRNKMNFLLQILTLPFKANGHWSTRSSAHPDQIDAQVTMHLLLAPHRVIAPCILVSSITYTAATLTAALGEVSLDFIYLPLKQRWCFGGRLKIRTK